MKKIWNSTNCQNSTQLEKLLKTHTHLNQAAIFLNFFVRKSLLYTIKILALPFFDHQIIMHVIHKKRKAKLYLTVLPTQRIMCDLGFYLTPNSSSRYLLNLGKSFRKLQRNHLINHLIHLPSLSITTQYNSDCIQLVFARVLIVVATSLFIKKFACENLWEWRKARTKYVQKTKIWMYPNTYRWEKKWKVLCICESNVCFRFFQNLFGFLFWFQSTEHTGPKLIF